MINSGSIMMDLEGTVLQQDEIEMLNHPAIGGLILFSRNFVSSEQLVDLVSNVRSSTNKKLLIAVDHEGGRVQRFKTDCFTHLPAMGKLVKKSLPLDDVKELGWLMAYECIAHGIDLSFAPVLDIEGGSDVIGDRAFSHNPQTVIDYASAWCEGVKSARMATIGKHFPGHGSTKEDSHVFAPVDSRNLADIFATDTLVFESLIKKQLLNGLMPAHIVFDQVDEHPVGYSSVWLQKILKQRLNFSGILFSDDLSMVGAGQNLSYLQKATLALNAGCDMVLACNNKKGVQDMLEQIGDNVSAQVTDMEHLAIAQTPFVQSMMESSRRKAAIEIVNKING